MKLITHKLLLTLGSALVLGTLPAARGAALTWDAGTDRNWNTTTPNWTGATWSNSTSDQATFGATGIGSVNLTAAITANKLTFENAGYTISGDTLTLGGTTPALTANADATISSIIAGSATITKDGAGKLTLSGANTLAGNVTVNQGTLELAPGGALTRGVTVGGPAANNATFNLAGGSITSTGGNFTVAGTASETGTANMSDGTLTLTGGEWYLGNANNTFATWTQTGGTVSVSTGNHIYTGMGAGSGVTTTMDFRGGSFVLQPGTSACTFSIGGRSQTAVTVSGTAVVDAHQTRFGWGADLSATDGGTLNLNGGTWQTKRIYRDVTVQSAEVNFNGGLLQARQHHTGFMMGLTSANIREGGARVDTSGFDITIAQPLLHGGSAGQDGGLVKSGGGRLTLAGANTYTGPTRVTGGTLAVAGSLPAAAAITVTNGTFACVAPEQTVADLALGNGGTLELAANAALRATAVTCGADPEDAATLRISIGGTDPVPMQCEALTTNGAAGSVAIELSGALTSAGTYHLIACPEVIGGTGFPAFRLATPVIAGYHLALVRNPGFIDLVATAPPLPELADGVVTVALDPTYPQALRFTLQANGATLEAGDRTAPREVRINGTAHAATVSVFEPSATEARYTLDVPGFGIQILYRFSVAGGALVRSITGITGPGEPNVQTINLDTPIIRANADQPGASAAFLRNVNPDLYANYSGSMAGDTIGAVTGLAAGSWDSTWCFVGTPQAVGTAYNNLFDYPFTVKVATLGGVKCAAIYDRDYNYRFKDIKPGVWFESKTLITGDANENGVIDWQDGALWVRDQLPPMLPALADHYARGGAWQQSSVGYLGNTTYSTVTTPYPLYASQMRKACHQTEGVPQAIACAGWTYRGHDWMWADWDQVVNPGGGGRAAYDKARLEAARYNGDLSFHLNQDLSAVESQHYDDSVMARNASGQKLGHYAYIGQNFYDISHFLDLQRGSLTSRINDFLDLFAPPPLVVYLDQMWNHPSALHGGNGAEEQYAKSIIVKTFRDRGTSTTTEGYQCSLFRHGMLQCKYRNNNVSHIDDFVTAGRLMWQFVSNPTAEFSDTYYMLFGNKISQEYRSGNLFGSSNWMGNVMMEDTYLLTMMNACMRKHIPMEYTSDSVKYQVRWGSDMFARVDKAGGKFSLTQGNVTLADGTDRFLPAPDGSMKVYVYSVSGSFGRSWPLPAAWNGVTRVDRYELTESGRCFIDRLPVSNGAVKLHTPGKVPYVLLPATGPAPTVGPLDNLRGKPATASSAAGTDGAANAVDGDDATCWTSSTGDGSWLAVELGREMDINRLEIKEAAGSGITGFRFQIDHSGSWTDVCSGTTVGSPLRKVFPNVRSDRVRLWVDSTGGAVRIAAFSVFADANLAMTATASASSNSGSGWGDDYVEGPLRWGRDIQASRAMDGAPETYWRPVGETAGAWLQADFSRSSKVNRVFVSETGNRVSGFKIQYWDGASSWVDVHAGTVIASACEIDFPTVETTRLRLAITAASAVPMIAEFAAFEVGGAIAVVTPPVNFATGGIATQSSTYSVSGAPQVASRAIDGNTDGEWSHNSLSCTANGSPGWWEVDMLSPKAVAKVAVWWRNTAFTRNRNVDLVIYDSPDPATRVELHRVAVSGNDIPPNPTVIDLGTPVRGRVVRLEHTPATDATDPNDAQLCLAEVVAEGVPGGYDAWSADSGLSSSNDRMDQDPDADGSNNLLEFALGGDPLAAADAGVFRAIDDAAAGVPGVAFVLATLEGAAFSQGPGQAMTASLNGITYQVEASADLTDWDQPLVEVFGATPGLPVAPGGYEYHRFAPSTAAAASPRFFVRVRCSGL